MCLLVLDESALLEHLFDHRLRESPRITVLDLYRLAGVSLSRSMCLVETTIGKGRATQSCTGRTCTLRSPTTARTDVRLGWATTVRGL